MIKVDLVDINVVGVHMSKGLIQAWLEVGISGSISILCIKVKRVLFAIKVPKRHMQKATTMVF